MAVVDLTTLLELVGNLNDSNEKGSASDRFRNYLRANVTQWAEVREYIEEALRHSGDQYNKALQDLINHLGSLLGFEVVFGRYRGTRGQVGFDGLWQSSTDWSIVVETKTTDVYTVRTATLLGYINSLVSDGKVTGTEKVVGLYVYGRFDANTNQLENAIAIENRRNQMRVVSVPALLDLLELKQQYRLTHESILGLILPMSTRIDPIVELIKGVVAQEQERDGLPIIDPLVESDEMSSKAQPKYVSNPARTSSYSGVRPRDYSNTKVRAVSIFGKSYAVTKWRQAFEAILSYLVEHDRTQFLTVAPNLVGKKRPYFSTDPSLLRQAGEIPGTELFFETNLGANSLAKLADELIQRMGYDRQELVFEVE